MEPKRKSGQMVFSLKKKICIGCCSFFGLVILVTSFFIPGLLNNYINKEIPSQVAMDEANSGLWAQLPGDSGVNLYRKITVYEPKNIIDVIFKGSKPEFIEHSNVYELIQRQEFINRTYEEDDKKIKYKVAVNRYTTFEEPQQTLQKYTTINPGLFGGWYLGKTLPPPKLAWMTVGAVIQNLKEQLPLNVYYLGFLYNLANTEEKALAFLAAEQNETKRKAMYHDEYMGLGNATTIENWVRLVLEGNDYGVAGSYLRDYFDLSVETLSAIRKSLAQGVTGLNQSAFPYYGCNPYGSQDKTKKYDCDGKYLMTLQWSKSGITGNPPPGMGIPPTPSVIFTNNTLHDYIEISFFYNYHFRKNVKDYGDMQFDLDWAYNFLDREYDYPSKPAYTEPYRLLHKGNVEFMYEVGSVFDKSGNLPDLQQIKDRFRCDSLEMAHVVYEWLKQMQHNFACRENFKGNQEFGVIGIFASESIYYRFRNLTEFLLPNLISKLVIQKQKWKDCTDMLEKSLDGLSTQQIESICAEPTFKNINEHTILSYQDLCQYGKYGPRLDEFAEKHKLDDRQKLQICDQGQTQESVQSLVQASHQDLLSKYQCQFGKCSKIELAIKQWARSEITLDPPNEKFERTYSVSDWDKSIFPQPFEYGYYAKHILQERLGVLDPQLLNDMEAKYVLHFESIFNPLAITTAFIYKENHPANQTEFVKRYQFNKYDDLLNYFRFVMINVMLGGPSVEKYPKDLFFGYSEGLGEDLKNRDPAGGGDKGINSWVRLGDPNMTLEDAYLFPQTFYTGLDQLNKTRNLDSYSRSDHAVYNYTYFDGNTTFKKWESPWKIEEKFEGATDGVIFPPFRNTEESVSFYVPQIFRTIRFLPSPGPELFGLDTIHYEVDPMFLKKSDDYYGLWDGTLNLEKPFMAPAVVSLPHFYQADPILSESVRIADEKNNTITGNQYDKIYANVEKFSGAPLEAVIQLQISMKIGKDSLFIGPSHDMALPLLSLYNSGNFTEDTASAKFKSLKIGLAVKNWGWYLIMGFGILLICISIGLVLHTYISSKRKVEDEANRALI